MADIQPQPDGSAQISVTAADTAGLKAIISKHLPFIDEAAKWFGADLAPELGDASTFLKGVLSSPAEGSTLTVSAPQAKALHGVLAAHIPDFENVLAVVESPAVRSLLTLAGALV